MTAGALLSRLRRNPSGVAMTEFALAAPLLFTVGLWGSEEANFALTNMRIGQLAVQIADNASRIGDTSTLSNRKIYEGDIDDLVYGAQLQGGKLGLYANGRVFISSLEVNSSGGQWIHWQRCRGAKHVGSSYGVQGDGATTGISGMGPAGAQVTADPGDAVIFVEVFYDYQPLITDAFLHSRTIHSIASFNVRDSRDLTQLYQRDPTNPDQVEDCTLYLGTPTVSTSGKVT